MTNVYPAEGAFKMLLKLYCDNVLELSKASYDSTATFECLPCP